MEKESLSAHGKIMTITSLIASDVGNTLTLQNIDGVNKWENYSS
jgi:hypothetical protein